MENKTLEELIEEYDKIQPCIDSGCGNSGIIANQVGEDEWEPQQCEYCYKIRFPVKAFIKKVYEAGGEAERERIVKEYGWFTDGCGCCADTSLQNELQVKNQNDKTTINDR